jgi:AraC-like DNA-binding protein
MAAQPFHDEARFFRSPALPDTEMLAARFFQHAFAPHWHECYVVAVITAGAEGYDYHGSRHVAGPGWLACINPDEIHTGERAADMGWAYRVFYPSAGVMRELARQLGAKGLPRLPLESVEDRPLAARLAHAHSLLQDGRDLLQAQTEALTALTALLRRHADLAPPPPPMRDAPRVEHMRQRMAADLAEPLTLDQLAAGVGLSAFHAARLFARHTGMAPHAWRNMLRVNRSLDLLRAGSSVAEAASACGFADQSHFTRHFRRAMGVPPGRWKG